MKYPYLYVLATYSPDGELSFQHLFVLSATYWGAYDDGYAEAKRLGWLPIKPNDGCANDYVIALGNDEGPKGL
jgi:hypothetical protein